MPAKKSYFKLIEERNEILWAPCIYDCVSAKCAEEIGFEAVTLSSTEQRHCFVGRPYMTQDEMFTSAEHIIRSTSCAVLVDGEDGGGTPMEVYRNVKRYAEAGAMAITIEDQFYSTDIGFSVIGVENTHKSYPYREKFIPAEIWAANIQAAVEACKGTECMVIARVNTKGAADGGPEKFKDRHGLGLEEAIRRARLGVEVGAPMTMMQYINYRGGRHEWEEICSRVPGLHCYPDIHAEHGVQDEDVNVLYEMGFQLVTCHCFQRGAWKGMMEYGKRLFEDKNVIYVENDQFDEHSLYQISPITFPEEGARCDHWIETIEKYRNFEK